MGWKLGTKVLFLYCRYIIHIRSRFSTSWPHYSSRFSPCQHKLLNIGNFVIVHKDNEVLLCSMNDSKRFVREKGFLRRERQSKLALVSLLFQSGKRTKAKSHPRKYFANWRIISAFLRLRSWKIYRKKKSPSSTMTKSLPNIWSSYAHDRNWKWCSNSQRTQPKKMSKKQ